MTSEDIHHEVKAQAPFYDWVGIARNLQRKIKPGQALSVKLKCDGVELGVEEHGNYTQALLIATGIV
jgi:hypothetical protein